MRQREALAAELAQLRALVEETVVGGPDGGRERALVLTKLDEAGLWLLMCTTRDER